MFLRRHWTENVGICRQQSALPSMQFAISKATPLISPDFPGFLENIAKLKRQETLYHEHGGRRDSIIAAGEIISRRRGTLYHRGTTHSITAARHTLSPRHETFYHRGTRQFITSAREIVSRRHERLYHGGTRHCITAAGEILSRRQARLYHDHSGRRDSITAGR